MVSYFGSNQRGGHLYGGHLDGLFNVGDPGAGEPQVGAGDNPFFEGIRFQRGFGRIRRFQKGRGIMGVLSKVWKYLAPMAKKYVAPMATDAVKAIAEEGLDAGQKVLSNISKGANVKEAVVTEGTQALKNLVKRAGHSLQQKGSGAPKRAKRTSPPKKRSVSNLHLVGRSVLASALRQKHNNLGLY